MTSKKKTAQPKSEAAPNGRSKNRGSRIYWKRGRAYGDFRNLGGKREALVPPGDTLATTDPDVAAKLAADRVTELTMQKREGALLGLRARATLGQFATHHLVEKAKAGRVSDLTIGSAELHLQRAVDFFGADRWLDSIGVADVEAWRTVLAAMPSPRGGTLSGGSQRHHLNALSNLYRRAQAEGAVPPGFNPIGAMMDKPTAGRSEAKWLEVSDAALFLESARTWKSKRDDLTNTVYPLVATFLLTGGRSAEIFGLTVKDVSFNRNTVTIRPNTYRGLKTKTSHRSLPLWPQLRPILRDHLFGRDEADEGLLFPSSRNGGPVWDLRKSIDRIAMRAGWAKGEITPRMFRHSYCAARLQTLDRGAPVSAWTVAKEMGHGGRSLVDRVYGHLGDIRHRSEVVEYRVEQHKKTLGKRLVGVLEGGKS